MCLNFLTMDLVCKKYIYIYVIYIYIYMLYVIFPISSSGIALDFLRKNLSSATKVFNLFFSLNKYKINIWYSRIETFCLIKNSIFIYQIFCLSFCWYCLNFFGSLFNSFSTSTCSFLFELTFLFHFFSLSSKSVIFTK